MAATVAVIVGWLVVGGSCFRSLPQILRILKFKSVEGLSLAAFTTEALSCSISVAYNALRAYPFSSYGDTAICLLQNYCIIGLIFVFNSSISRRTRLLTVAALAAGAAFLFSPLCSPALLTALEMGTVAMLAGARIPQIVLNMQRGNSGELSMASTGLSVTGNAMRVFTTLALVKDPLILAGNASMLALNSVLLWQTICTHQQQRATAAAAAPAAA